MKYKHSHLVINIGIPPFPIHIYWVGKKKKKYLRIVSKTEFLPGSRDQNRLRPQNQQKRLWQQKWAQKTIQFSCSVMSDSLWPHESQHARPPCPSPTPRVHSNSCPSSRWCHPPISSSVFPFSSCPQSLPASETFPMSQFFAWGAQRIGALASLLPKNTQDWSLLEWTGWISLQAKGLSRVISNTTVQKHQFFSTQLSSQSYIHHTWPLEKP